MAREALPPRKAAPGKRAVSKGAGEAPRVRFGESLRAARKRAGLSQAALAERAGIHQADLSEIERGARNLTFDTAAALVAAVQVRDRVLFATLESFGKASPTSSRKAQRRRPPAGQASEEPLLPLFGGNLRRARERAGLTKARLAELAGIGRSDLHWIEAGALDITLGVASRLATALGVDLRDLFEDPAADS